LDRLAAASATQGPLCLRGRADDERGRADIGTGGQPSGKRHAGTFAGAESDSKTGGVYLRSAFSSTGATVSNTGSGGPGGRRAEAGVDAGNTEAHGSGTEACRVGAKANPGFATGHLSLSFGDTFP